MKKLVIVVLFLLSCMGAYAQKTTVKGAVLDSLTRAGEPGAILQFYRLPDTEKAVAFTTTDEQGQFSHSFTLTGDYVLVFDNMGREVQRRYFTVPADTEVVDLGEILARDSAEMLKAGQVMAMRPLVKMEVDKMVYNVVDDVDAKTSTVLDMLRKVPMVSVDAQDKISVNGSSSFLVYVDGKPNQMLSQNASTIFKMMPASAIKEIEVVTNPGVKYDAEGVGGVLKLTTNKAVTGGASASEGYYGTVMAVGSNRGGGAGVSASMQKGKVSASVNASAMYAAINDVGTDTERIQDNGFTTKTHSETDMKMPMAMVNGSASYDIDSLNLVSLTLGVMHYGMKNSTSLLNEMYYAQSSASAYTYNGLSDGLNNQTNLSLGADYQHLWADAPGRSLVFSYQFNGSPSVNNSENKFDGSAMDGFSLTDRKSLGTTGSYDHTLQIDFTNPLGKLFTLSTGAKYIDRHNSSDQTDYLWDGSDYVESPASSLQYDFYNRIGAAYAEMEGKIGTFGVKAGARYEHTWQSYNSTRMAQAFHVNYGALVPSASLQWSPSMTQNIGLSYNMRISRPGITYLNPYVDTTDPTALSYGNTELKVETGHNVSLVYNFYTPVVMVNATLRHSFTPNGISSYSFYDSNNMLNTTYGNIVKSNNTGLNGFVMLMPGKRTRIMLNGGVSYSDLRSEQLNQQNAGWAYNLMAGLQQTLPWDIRMSANVVSMGKSVTLQGWSSGAQIGVLGLTKTFLNDKLSLSLNGVLPLAKKLEMNMETYSEGNGFTTRTSTMVPMKALTFQISWTFGKQGNFQTKKARRTIENEGQLNSASQAESMGSLLQM